MSDERVTVTLPRQMVADIDRIERNRSKFVREAIRNELKNRRAESLRRSLANPHPESRETGDLGFEAWVSAGHADDVVDPEGGKRVTWRPGQGWGEAEE